MPSNIKSVYAMLNESKYIASYSESTEMWIVSGTAPAESSWGQSDHVFLITLHAEDNAGNEVSMTSEDPTYGDQLKLRVLEKTKPVATIVSPTQGSVLGSSTQNIVMKLSDSGGSGLNMDSVTFKINNIQIQEELNWEDSEGKKVCTYSASNLPDGSNSISLQVTDNDGNTSTETITTFIISTAAPALSVTSPTEGLITNSKTITVSGVVSPGSDSVTISTLTINEENVDIGENGAFSKEVTFDDDGNHTITVIATDSIGKTTQVTRNVLIDTKAPIISEVVAESTVVDASGNFKITFKVVDPT